MQLPVPVRPPPRGGTDSSTTDGRWPAPATCTAASGVPTTAPSVGGPASPGLAPTPVDADRLEALCTQLGLVGSGTEGVISRFRDGADLGLSGPVPERFTPNNRSAIVHATAVSAAVREEVAAGVTRGPFRAPPLPQFHVNPLSAREKGNGKVRIILDMSAPSGHSVNDLIDLAVCSLQYAILDQLAGLIFQHGGVDAKIFKADIQAAFKLIPVKLDQHAALGFYWEDSFSYQVALPFGCRASPRIFNEFATLLRDLVRAQSHNPAVLNYLDDFFGVELASPPAETSTYQYLLDTFHRLGVPLSHDWEEQVTRSQFSRPVT